MTTRILQNLSDLRDRRIMMEKKLPAFGYALSFFWWLSHGGSVWSTQNKRTLRQSTGSVRTANKTCLSCPATPVPSPTEHLSEGQLCHRATSLPPHIQAPIADISRTATGSGGHLQKAEETQYEKLLESIRTTRTTSETDIDD